MKNYFTDLVLKRQSCRNFNDKPLKKEVVLDIAKQSINAPSACNSQPWKLYVVTSPDNLELVKQSVQDQGHNMFTEKAKAFIAISETRAQLKSSVRTKFADGHFIKYDIGELIAYITLTAESMGVSTCILGWVDAEKLKASLSMTDDEVCNIVIALGYSDIEVKEKKRKPIEETIIEK